MYYDAFFPEFGLASLNATRESVRLLNRLGVVPVVSPEERCCGHDLAWNGDRSSFEALAKHNMALVAESGAETVVTPCAECYRTWSIDYASLFNGRRPRVLHLSEFLADRLSQLPLQSIKERQVTFQDPCRLGRHMGVYEAPRKVLEAIPGVTVVEMPRHGARAVCCAGGTWSNCDRFAKQIQTDRLREARATGADTMVTACPKCQIHFRCAMVDPNIHEEIEIEMCDISQLVGEALA